MYTRESHIQVASAGTQKKVNKPGMKVGSLNGIPVIVFILWMENNLAQNNQITIGTL